MGLHETALEMATGVLLSAMVTFLAVEGTIEGWVAIVAIMGIAAGLGLYKQASVGSISRSTQRQTNENDAE